MIGIVEGLAVGDSVIVTGLMSLKNGQAVVAKKVLNQ